MPSRGQGGGGNAEHQAPALPPGTPDPANWGGSLGQNEGGPSGKIPEANGNKKAETVTFASGRGSGQRRADEKPNNRSCQRAAVSVGASRKKIRRRLGSHRAPLGSKKKREANMYDSWGIAQRATFTGRRFCAHTFGQKKYGPDNKGPSRISKDDNDATLCVAARRRPGRALKEMV